MKFIPILFTAAALGSAAASAQALIPLDDKRLPFTVQLPKTWLGVQIQDGTSGVSLTSAKTKPASLMRLLFSGKGGQNITTAILARDFEAGLKSSGSTVKQVAERAAKYGGVQGLEREYVVSEQGKQIQMRVWYGSGARNVYAFQVSDTVSRFPAASATFSKVLSTVRFR